MQRTENMLDHVASLYHPPVEIITSFPDTFVEQFTFLNTYPQGSRKEKFMYHF